MTNFMSAARVFIGITFLVMSHLASALIIDNNLLSHEGNYFSVNVLTAGDTQTVKVTDPNSIRQDEDIVNTYNLYVVIDGVSTKLSDFNGTVPTLISEGKVRSTGFFTGVAGNIIEWVVESFIQSGAVQMRNAISFNAITGTLGDIQVIQYMDEDVNRSMLFNGSEDSVFFSRVSASQNNIKLFTLDNNDPVAIGVSQGGAQLEEQGLINSYFDGWAACIDFGSFSNLLVDGSTTYDQSGEVCPALSLLNTNHPDVGAVKGAADIVSAMAWSVEPGANQSMIISTLKSVPDAGVVLAADDHIELVENTNSVDPKVFDILDNDIALDTPISFQTLSAPISGSISPNGAIITYTPNLQFFGQDSFTYLIQDGSGDSDTATVFLTVLEDSDEDGIPNIRDEDANDSCAPSILVAACDINNNGIADGIETNALEIIKNYADDDTQQEPTEIDYSNLTINDVTASNISEINAIIASLFSVEVGSVAEVQAVVDSVVASQAAIADLVNDLIGTVNTVELTLDQLKDILNVSGILDENMAEYNDAFIADLSPFADINIPTVSEIQAVIASINIIVASETAALYELKEDIAGNINNNLVEASELNAIRGVNGALTANQDEYQAAFTETMPSPFVDPANPTSAEIQTLVDVINANELDTDGDGIPDVIDMDDDNDGLLDIEETDIGGLNPDQDGDGICDGDLAVSNACTGGPDENSTNPDADGNGICDGIIAFSASDSFKGCMVNVNFELDADSDSDGIEDSAELDGDSDGDLIPDYLDPDDAGLAPDYGDSDTDGIDDKEECGSALPCRDTDNNIIYDFLDLDSDSDGLTDDEEADGTASNGAAGTVIPKDSDADGLPDYRDLDSDNDGKPDEDEIEFPHDSANPKDTDNDGIPNVVDHDDSGDQSGGGDSDNDGLTDAKECPNYPTNCPDSDNDGQPDYLDNNNDSDDDGISDAEEDPNFDKDNDPATYYRDTDNDGTPDYLDEDSDNDGKQDVAERDEPYDANNPRDTDGDGIPDVIDADDGTADSDNKGNGVGDSDNDSIPDDVECGSQPCRDTDGDGIPDYTDTDADNDGLLDENEVGADLQNPKDTDGDGIPDIADPVNGGAGENGGDSDGDGVADADECSSWPNCSDSDNDGLADYFDENSWPAIIVLNLDTTSEQAFGKIKTGVRGAGSLYWGFALMLLLLVMFRRKSAVLVALPIMVASLNTSAEWWDEMDLYAGAGIGQSYLDPSLGVSGYNIDDYMQSAWKLTVGWDWNDHISVEGYYSDLGSVELNPRAKIGYRMMGGDAMLHFWAYGEERMEGSVALYAKAGLNHMTNNGNNVSYEKNNTLQLLGGIGAEVYLPRKFSVRFEIESYDADAALLSLNVMKRFGFKSKKVKQKEFLAMVKALPKTASGGTMVMLTPVVLDSDSDGLLDDDDQCPYTPKSMNVNGVGCATFVGEVSDLIANVHFETNSSSLTDASKVVLNEIANMLVSYAAIDIEVQAHSDNTGSAAYNKILSQKRARSVVKYLTEKSILRSRLRSLGFGEKNPIADNNTVMGRSINRRVEFKLKQR
jgi:outer membrane protein OmpA-like peptidoglycan-associated protein